MAVVGLDLGGTKLAAAVFAEDGEMMERSSATMAGQGGSRAAALISNHVLDLMESAARGGDEVRAVGVAVPGIFHAETGRVWAPNIREWSDYPLLDELREAVGPGVAVAIESDRTCYILGEVWRGCAVGCTDAIYLSVGTGIGAGILTEGRVLRGHRGVAGAVGWLALDRPFREEYAACGCFEYHASGPGLAAAALSLLVSGEADGSVLHAMDPAKLSARDVFVAYEQGDPPAIRVVESAVRYWGMAVANLVSVFNPEVIVLGGGVFGPAVRLIDRIRDEALLWAQPISIHQVRIEPTRLGGDAGLIGAGGLALQAMNGRG
jgi:glucokinase